MSACDKRWMPNRPTRIKFSTVAMYSSVVECYNSNNAGFCKLIINYTDITNILVLFPKFVNWRCSIWRTLDLWTNWISIVPWHIVKSRFHCKSVERSDYQEERPGLERSKPCNELTVKLFHILAKDRWPGACSGCYSNGWFPM